MTATNKTIVMTIGAGAVGKSTLTRVLCGLGGEEHTTTLTCYEHKADTKVTERVTYTLFPNGLTIAGNLRNGSDSVSHMDALRQLVNLCWERHDTVIVDTVRSTHQFVDWIREHPLRPLILFVYLSPSLDENLARLRSRRAARGVIEAQLPAKTFWHVLSFRARARSVWMHAQNQYWSRPVRFLKITEGTPTEAAKRVVAVLQEMQSHAPHDAVPTSQGQLSKMLGDDQASAA